MKKLTSILALFIICFTANAQGIGKKITGEGATTTENRSVGNFDKIGVAGSFDVQLVKGKEGEITVSAQGNLMKYIITEVDKGTLKIKTKKGFRIKSMKNIKLTVAFNDLEAISLAGSGDIKGDDSIKSNALKLNLSGSGNMVLAVDASELAANISGSGNINLQGNSDDFSCAIAGSGNINGYDLKAGTTEAKIAGSGNIKVHAVNEVHAKIAGSGNVYYSGNPSIEKSNSAGSGSLKKKN